MARIFVSCFIYETDATFNINELRMPLSILVGVLNTGKTFPFAFCFITSETTTSFEFMEDQLNSLFFHNCPRLQVICGDFAKVLASAIARREAEHQQAGHERHIFFSYVNGIGLKQSNVTWLRLVDIQRSCLKKSLI